MFWTMFITMAILFFTTLFNPFVISEWFDLNSSSSSPSEILPITDFLVDFLIYLCIPFMALKMLEFSSSGLILITTQPSSFSIAFYLSILE